MVTPNLGNSLDNGVGVLGLGLAGPLDCKPPLTCIVSLVTGKVGAGVVNRGAPVDRNEEDDESVFGSILS